MDIIACVDNAARHGASDLHLEPSLPVAMRVDGKLSTSGPPLTADDTASAAKQLMGASAWSDLETQRSWDGSRTLNDVRCRIHASFSRAGVGLAVRLLARFEASLERFNLHRDLSQLVHPSHGLVIVSGPTGSGKSSTLAALIEEINTRSACHIVTLENPVEYTFVARRAFIRQREVGRDTPSFEHGLRDALRQDPDVLMVGEMRRPETMRLTLDAAETGHLVLTSTHASSTIEAVQRVVASFAPEVQHAVRLQLADSLVAVVSQRLRWLSEPGLRVPECEILTATDGVRAIIRQGHFHKLASAIESGREGGMWTFDRYRRWLDQRHDWCLPERFQPPVRATPQAPPIVAEKPLPTPIRPVAPLPPRRRETSDDLRRKEPSAALAQALSELVEG